MRPLIKNYCRGSVPRDGMTGGRWENTTRLAYKDIPVERLTECISDEEKAEKCLSWLKERIGESIRVEAYFDVGYDHSVGLDNYCDMYSNPFPPDQSVVDAISFCPVVSAKDRLKIGDTLSDIAEEEEGYELYEID